MKKVLKLILRAPFLLLNKIIIDKKSLLWRISDDILNDKDKIELSKKAQFKIIAQKSPPKGFKIISYLNALRHDTIIANSFSKNVIEHTSSNC